MLQIGPFKFSSGHFAAFLIFLVGAFGAQLLPAGSLAAFANVIGPWLQLVSMVIAFVSKSIVPVVPPVTPVPVPVPVPVTIVPATPPSPAPAPGNPMTRGLVRGELLRGLGVASILVLLLGFAARCTTAQKAAGEQAIQEAAPAFSCVLALVFQGVTDPAAIAAKCAGVSVTAIEQIVTTELTAELAALGDASPIPAAQSRRLVTLQSAQSRARTAISSGKVAP